MGVRLGEAAGTATCRPNQARPLSCRLTRLFPSVDSAGFIATDMAELALGVMGVIPLLGAAYKSYRSVYSTLKAYKHSSRDLSNISKRFRLAKSYFQHECCLLLRFALDEESIKAMRADLDHENWSTPDLEAQLQESLASGYASCELLADGINESLKKFGDELQLFEDLANDHPEVSRCLTYGLPS